MSMMGVEVKKLSKEYSNFGVLDNLSLNIAPGEFVSIIGPNGCGKTTLLNIIAGLDSDYVGSVRFANCRRKKVSMVFQNPKESVLLWKTVLENIFLDKKDVDKRAVKNVLRGAGLWRFRHRYPYQLFVFDYKIGFCQ